MNIIKNLFGFFDNLFSGNISLPQGELNLSFLQNPKFYIFLTIFIIVYPYMESMAWANKLRLQTMQQDKITLIFYGAVQFFSIVLAGTFSPFLDKDNLPVLLCYQGAIIIFMHFYGYFHINKDRFFIRALRAKIRETITDKAIEKNDDTLKIHWTIEFGVTRDTIWPVFDRNYSFAFTQDDIEPINKLIKDYNNTYKIFTFSAYPDYTTGKYHIRRKLAEINAKPIKFIPQVSEQLPWYVFAIGASNGKNKKTIRSTMYNWRIQDWDKEPASIIKKAAVLPRAPQAFVIGSTGGGKSVFLGTLIEHLATHNARLYLIDMKKVEFKPYEDLPAVKAVGTNFEQALAITKLFNDEMHKRLEMMSEEDVKEVPTYDTEFYYDNSNINADNADSQGFTQCKEKWIKKASYRVSKNTALDKKKNVYTKVKEEDPEYQEGKSLWKRDGKVYDKLEIPEFREQFDYFDGSGRPISHKKYLVDTYPPMFLIIDEAAELFPTNGNFKQQKLQDEIHENIESIARLGRAAHVHIVMASQSASGNIFDTQLKNNMGQRFICGRVEDNISQNAIGDYQGSTIPKIPGYMLGYNSGDSIIFRGFFLKTNVVIQRSMANHAMVDCVLDHIDINKLNEENEDKEDNKERGNLGREKNRGGLARRHGPFDDDDFSFGIDRTSAHTIPSIPKKEKDDLSNNIKPPKENESKDKKNDKISEENKEAIKEEAKNAGDNGTEISNAIQLPTSKGLPSFLKRVQEQETPQIIETMDDINNEVSQIEDNDLQLIN